MSRRVIVFDTNLPVFQANRVLDAAYAARFPGASFIPELARKAAEAGVEMETADVFLARETRQVEAVALTDAATRFTTRLIRRGVRMGVVFCAESPNIMPWFYHDVGRYIRRYAHAVLFRGCNARSPAEVQFHPFYWPCAVDRMLDGPVFTDRALLVMVAGNKQRFPINPSRPLRSLVGNIARWTRWRYYEAIDPWLRLTDLYEARLQALEHFANRPGFCLYGVDWERDRGRDTRVGRLPFPIWPTPCADKLETMSAFRFSLCFENCVFPGYVTEKILDSFLAGCVPVYHGAPDIAEFCPAECFIDFRDYGSFEDLERALRSYPEAAWQRKREAIRAYLQSPAFEPYRPGTFAASLMKWLYPD